MGEGVGAVERGVGGVGRARAGRVGVRVSVGVGRVGGGLNVGLPGRGPIGLEGRESWLGPGLVGRES